MLMRSSPTINFYNFNNLGRTRKLFSWQSYLNRHVFKILNFPLLNEVLYIYIYIYIFLQIENNYTLHISPLKSKYKTLRWKATKSLMIIRVKKSAYAQCSCSSGNTSYVIPVPLGNRVRSSDCNYLFSSGQKRAM